MNRKGLRQSISLGSQFRKWSSSKDANTLSWISLMVLFTPSACTTGRSSLLCHSIWAFWQLSFWILFKWVSVLRISHSCILSYSICQTMYSLWFSQWKWYSKCVLLAGVTSRRPGINLIALLCCRVGSTSYFHSRQVTVVTQHFQLDHKSPES